MWKTCLCECVSWCWRWDCWTARTGTRPSLWRWRAGWGDATSCSSPSRSPRSLRRGQSRTKLSEREVSSKFYFLHTVLILSCTMRVGIWNTNRTFAGNFLRVYFGKPGQTNKSKGGGRPGSNRGPTCYKADVLSITLWGRSSQLKCQGSPRFTRPKFPPEKPLENPLENRLENSLEHTVKWRPSQF